MNLTNHATGNHSGLLGEFIFNIPAMEIPLPGFQTPPSIFFTFCKALTSKPAQENLNPVSLSWAKRHSGKTF